MAAKKQKIDEKEPSEKKIGLFDVMDMIQGAKVPWDLLEDDYHKAYSQYMINRFISSKEMYIPLIEQICRLKLTDEQHYKILCDFVSNARYFDYKSYKKTKEEPDIKLLTFAIAKEYELGYREARTYINKLDDVVKTKLKNKWKDLYDSQI